MESDKVARLALARVENGLLPELPSILVIRFPSRSRYSRAVKSLESKKNKRKKEKYRKVAKKSSPRG